MASGIELSVLVDATTDPLAALITPRQVEQVNRKVVNKSLRAIDKEVGGTVPRAAGTSVVGFRRKRVFKTLAKARRKAVIGNVWIGANSIPAKYGGKLKSVTGGAKAGRHYFPGSFVATMPNGYRSIFHKNDTGDLIQDMIKVPDSNKHALRALDNTRSSTSRIIHNEIKRILDRNAT